MPNKYLFQNMFDVNSFKKGFGQLETQLKEIDVLIKNIGKGTGKGELKELNKVLTQLNKQENKLTKAQKERQNVQKANAKLLAKVNRENQKRVRMLKKVADSLNVEKQTEKEMLKIKQQRVRQEARLNAQRKLGIKQTKSWASSMKGLMTDLRALGGLMVAAFAFQRVKSAMDKYIDAARAQILVEQKLSVILKERTNATDAQVKSVLDLAIAQQKVGVIGDEVQLAGAQQFATFVKTTKSVETLLPAMNNLIAQQKGLNATQEDAVNIANLVGRAFQGQLGSLTRVGISFDEAQGKILKFGTEEEKAAALANILTQNVGNMNEEMAKTDVGRIKQYDNAIGDLTERIGKKLIPVFADLKEAAVKSLTEIESITSDFIDVFEDLKSVSRDIRGVEDANEDLKESFFDVGPHKRFIMWAKKISREMTKMKRRTIAVTNAVKSLQDQFNMLSIEMKVKATEEFKELNRQFKAGELSNIEYMKAVNALIVRYQKLIAEQDNAEESTESFGNTQKKITKEINKDIVESLKDMEVSLQEESEILGTTIGAGILKGLSDAVSEGGTVSGLSGLLSGAAGTGTGAAGAAKKSLLSRILGVDEDEVERIKSLVADAFNQFMNVISDRLSIERKANDERLAMADEQIAKTNDLLKAERERLAAIEEKGQATDSALEKSLLNRLRGEKMAKEKALAEDKRLKQKQKRLDIISAQINTFQAISNALSLKPTWLAIVMSAIMGGLGLAQVANIQRTKYAKGTNYLELNGNPNGTDTIPIWADKGERIVPRKDNAGIPRTFPNSLLPTAVSYFLDSKSGTPILNARSEGLLSQIATNTKQDGKVYENGKLKMIENKYMKVTYG